MIQQQEKIYTLLTSDSTLAALLLATATDKKIYPIITEKFEAFPCVTYAVTSGSFRTVPKNTQDVQIEFHIYSKTSKQHVEQIYSRINYLLNYYKITNSDIVYMRQATEVDVPETDRMLHAKVVGYRIWAKIT